MRTGFRKIILGLHILEGGCVNDIEGVRMRVRAGSRPISGEDIDRADLLIIEGLSMLEGVCVSCLKVSVCHVCVICLKVCECVSYVCVRVIYIIMCVCVLCTTHSVVHNSLKPNPLRHHHRVQSQRFDASMLARFYSLR